MLDVAGCDIPLIYEILVTKFCRWQTIGEWQVAAKDKALRLQHVAGFVRFMIPSTTLDFEYVDLRLGIFWGLDFESAQGYISRCKSGDIPGAVRLRGV